MMQKFKQGKLYLGWKKLHTHYSYTNQNLKETTANGYQQ